MHPVNQLQFLLSMIFKNYKFRANSEKEFASNIEFCLREHDCQFEREVDLGEYGRPDFMLPAQEGKLVLELKMRGSLTPVLQQLKRYADHPEVAGVMLVTTRLTQGVPRTLSNKPCFIHRVWMML